MLRVVVVFAGQARTWSQTRQALYDMFDGQGDIRYIYLSPDETEYPDIRFATSCDKILYPSSCLDKHKAINDQWAMLELAARQCENIACDWIIRCRPDLKIVKQMEHLYDLAPDALYFPRHNNWGGLNDRFWFGPKDMMIDSFRYYQSAHKHLRKPINLERLLARHVVVEKKIKVKRTRAILTPLRADGRLDPIVYRDDRGDTAPKVEVTQNETIRSLG